MTKMTIVIEVPAVDPTLSDPHGMAESMIESHNDFLRSCGESEFSFVSAEWVD